MRIRSAFNITPLKSDNLLSLAINFDKREKISRKFQQNVAGDAEKILDELRLISKNKILLSKVLK